MYMSGLSVGYDPDMSEVSFHLISHKFLNHIKERKAKRTFALDHLLGLRFVIVLNI
jgi:hypothetical protein